MITPNLTYEEYSALPGFNSSLLKVPQKKSMRHVKAYLDGECERDSDALDFGHSFHEMLLRGREDFIVRPDTYTSAPAKVKLATDFEGEWSPNKKVCKEWKATHEADGFEVMTPEQYAKASEPKPWNWGSTTCKAFAARHAGKVIHSAEEATRLCAMVAAVKAHPEIAPHLRGQAEVAVTAERNGVAYKALVDLLPDAPDAPVIDFKKCRSAQPHIFTDDAERFGYFQQAALNLDVLAWNGQKRPAFWFVAVEDTAPHVIWIMKLRDVAPSCLRMGRARYRAAVKRIQDAQETGNWPAYESGEPEEFLRSYHLQELEQTA